jgi:hypothetical protein
MQRFFILFGQFTFSSLLTFLLASVVHSQFVMQGLLDIDIKISVLQRLQMTLQDIQGLFATLGAIISVSLLLGFCCVALINKLAKSKRHNTYLYPLAGASAMWVMIAAMHPIMNITVLASARSLAGLVSLCICGAIGGSVFQYLRTVGATESN